MQNIYKHSLRQLMYKRMRAEFLGIPQFAELTKKQLTKALRKHCVEEVEREGKKVMRHCGFDAFLRNNGKYKTWIDFIENWRHENRKSVRNQTRPARVETGTRLAARKACRKSGKPMRCWRQFVAA